MPRPSRTPRLRRSDCSGPGLRRVRRGRGFSFLDETGERVTDEETIVRIRELGIPPAWQEVWICSDPRGHLQATGVDAAGRKQYLYHAVWRDQRDRAKFRKMEEFAQALPQLRRQVSEDLAEDGLTRARVVACAVRMIDVGQFRIGTEEYAKEEGGIGLATLGRHHVTLHGEVAIFDYPAKSGIQRHYELRDPDAVAVVAALRRRRGGPDELLAFRDGERARWRGIPSDEINDYIKRHAGEEFSAKDFRTWNATVLAAVALGERVANPPLPKSTKRVFSAVAKEVAAVLGNTPAVARRSYIDPRVFDRYPVLTVADGLRDLSRLDETPERRRRMIELEVLKVLHEDEDASGVEHHPELADAI